ncbi:hypothetical protein HanRHA438_Chr14g0661821 [Helianthus annuus]|nr:hypothetical protein HanIR_Chr14g0706331 [Helianthus annuus]KAJ0854366.1 hypothetical protein HanRHA438_Chr14g0661821 [Helianthus annuus]
MKAFVTPQNNKRIVTLMTRHQPPDTSLPTHFSRQTRPLQPQPATRHHHSIHPLRLQPTTRHHHSTHPLQPANTTPSAAMYTAPSSVISITSTNYKVVEYFCFFQI